MKTEVQQLESLTVGKNLTESNARKLAKEKSAKILTSRWANTQKASLLVRCWLVVQDFASGAESAFRSGIYAPMSWLDSLRCVLALASLWDLWLISLDVSTAFMYAEVTEDGHHYFGFINYNGLLILEVRTHSRAHFFRISTKQGLILILVYVDLLIASQDQKEGEDFLAKLMAIWKMKITGRIVRKTTGALEFLKVGQSTEQKMVSQSLISVWVWQYMVGIFESGGENIKAGHTILLLRLEDIHKEAVKKSGEDPLIEKGEQRYRRVLGQLAWAASSRADPSFPISFLFRFQAKPNPAAGASTQFLAQFWFSEGVVLSSFLQSRKS